MEQRGYPPGRSGAHGKIPSIEHCGPAPLDRKPAGLKWRDPAIRKEPARYLSEMGRSIALRYESTGIETRFTSRLDPDPKSRDVFAFQPETLLGYLEPIATQRPAREPSDFGSDAEK